MMAILTKRQKFVNLRNKVKKKINLNKMKNYKYKNH